MFGSAGKGGDESDGQVKKKGGMFGGMFTSKASKDKEKEDEEEKKRIEEIQEQINNNNQQKIFLEMKARDMAIKKAKAEAEMRRLEEAKKVQSEKKVQAERDREELEMIQKQLVSEKKHEVEEAKLLEKARQAKDLGRVARANRRVDIKYGMTSPIFEHIRGLFQSDLEDLIDHVKTALDGNEDDSSVFEFPPHPDIILAAMLAAATHKWKPPMISWRARDIMDGALIFLEQLTSPRILFDELSLVSLPRCTPAVVKRFEHSILFFFILNALRVGFLFLAANLHVIPTLLTRSPHPPPRIMPSHDAA